MNFGVAIVVARSTTPGEFGLFVLALSTYWLALGLTRAITCEPLLIRYSSVDRAARDRGVESALAVAIVFGVVLGGLAIATGKIAGGDRAEVLFVVTGLGLPALLAHDVCRHAFLAAGRVRAAFILDLAWLLCASGGLLALAALAALTPAWTIAAWAAAAGLIAAGTVVVQRWRLDLRGGAEWLGRHRDLAPALFTEFLAMSGAAQFSLYIVASISGVTAVAAIRGAQILLGPYNVLLLGTPSVAVPNGVRELSASPERLRTSSARISLVLAGGAIACGAAVEVIPEQVGRELLGTTWAISSDVVLPLSIAMAGAGVVAGSLIGLRVLAAARRSMHARLILAMLTIIATAIGASLGDATGAAIGVAVALWFGAGVWRWQFTRALQEHDFERLTGRGVSTVVP
jgi:hypothetical protein